MATEPSPSDDVPNVRPSRTPLIVAAVVVLAGIGAAVWFFTRPDPSPHRILVAVRCDAGCAATVQENLILELEQLGFDAVPDADHPAPDELARVSSIEQALELAPGLDAEHAVFVDVRVAEDRPGLTVPARYVTLDGSARVASLGARPGEPHTTTWGVEAESREAAARSAARAFAGVFAPDVATEVVQAASTQAFLRDSGGLSQMETAAALERTRKMVEGRVVALERYRQSCATADQALTKLPFRCLSRGCAEEYAAGLTADGRTVLLHSESPEPFFALDRPDPFRAEVPERLELVHLDGWERRVIATAGNFYGYPNLSADGRTVAFVEAAGDRHGIVAIDVASRRRSVLFTVDWPARVIGLRLSPDGSRVAFLYRRHRRDRDLAVGVVGTNGDKEQLLVRGADLVDWVTLPLPTGTPARPLLALLVRGEDEDVFLSAGGMSREPDPGAAPERTRDEGDGVIRDDAGADDVPHLPPGPLLSHVAVIDPDGAQVLARIGGVDRTIVDVIGAQGDRLWVSWRSVEQGCGIGAWNATTSEQTWTVTATCLRDLALATDGTLVGSAQASSPGDPSPEDDELVRVDPATGAITPITRDDVRERYPYLASGAPSLVVFERLPERPYRRLPRVSVCAVER